VRDDLPFRLKRSAKKQFGALSRSKQKHCFCAAKTLARLDRANDKNTKIQYNRTTSCVTKSSRQSGIIGKLVTGGVIR